MALCTLGTSGTIVLMQDDVKPGWAKKPKPDTKSETTSDAPDEQVASTTDNAPASNEAEAVDSGVDEKKIEQEFGPPPPNIDDVEEHMQPAFHKHPWQWVKGLSKPRKIVYGLLLLLVLATVPTVIYLAHKDPPPVASYPVYRKPTPTTVPSKLTGLQVDPAVNELQVTGVMIENSVFARPQSGLNHAGVVFEAVAEAGITRFLALFQDTQSNYIGPVRSARPYYVQWCQNFDCALAHVGGSPEALQNIKQWGVKNLDQFAGGSYFHRITSRYAPHNVYTSQDKLTAYEKSRGYTKSDYTGFEHLIKEPKVTQTASTIKSIDFNYPGRAYDVHYDYRAQTNDYARSEGAARHMSRESDGTLRQNAPKVVIALIMSYSLKGDSYHSNYQTVGSGSMYVFQNGAVTKGTWTRQARGSQFVFTDATGKAIQLNPGQAWISVLSHTSDVTYK